MASAITIKSATDSDREWCAQLMSSSEPWTTLGRTLDQCRARLSHPEYLLWVAHDGDRPTGFLLAHPRGAMGSPYIASIAVTPSHRGKGIGTQLAAYAEIYFAETQRHIFLCVSSFNSRARELYERLGYETIGELDGYAIPNASEVLMHKWLVKR